MKNPIIAIRTDLGEMQFELFEELTPNTVANIITLAESGFYTGQYFHRIINGFMAQGGCPYSKKSSSKLPVGSGGPGYNTEDETTPELQHDMRGLLSTANVGRPNTNGSQFFITFQETPWLDGMHTIFGQIIHGMEVLDLLEAAGTPSGKPKKKINFDIKVIYKNDHPYTFKKLHEEMPF